MLTVEGHAIVSVDGMIADASGEIPAILHNAADWAQYQRALDAATVVVTGRIGHERFPNPGRRRLVLTRSVETIMPDPRDPLSTLWNPAAFPLAGALERLGVGDGIVAITGVFGMFLADYDRFQLSESNLVLMPGGMPCFPHGHPRMLLAHAGLRPVRTETLDAAAAVASTLWTRTLDSPRPTG